jgi:hypothetical protein
MQSFCWTRPGLGQLYFGIRATPDRLALSNVQLIDRDVSEKLV